MDRYGYTNLAELYRLVSTCTINTVIISCRDCTLSCRHLLRPHIIHWTTSITSTIYSSISPVPPSSPAGASKYMYSKERRLIICGLLPIWCCPSVALISASSNQQLDLPCNLCNTYLSSHGQSFQCHPSRWEANSSKGGFARSEIEEANSFYHYQLSPSPLMLKYRRNSLAAFGAMYVIPITWPATTRKVYETPVGHWNIVGIFQSPLMAGYRQEKLEYNEP